MAYVCTTCQKLVETPGTFCPFCGQQNIEETVGFSSGEKIKMFVLSMMFAPFGLIYFFKYFKSEDAEKRKVAFIILGINIVVIIMMLGSITLMRHIYETSYKPVLDMYEGIY